MNTPRSLRLAATCLTAIVALGLLAPACKSESGEAAKSEEKGEGGAAAAAVTPGKVEVPEQGEAAPPAVDLVAPGKVNIDQAMVAMGHGAEHRLELRVKPLVDSGLVATAMEAMPAPQKSDYDAFVAESGFDPVKQFSGVLAYGDGNLETLGDSGATVVVGIEGGVSEQLIAYLDKNDEEDEDDEASDGFWTVILLAELTAEAQGKLIEALLKDEADEAEKSERKDLDGATYLVKADGVGTKYAFVWSGGILIGRVPSAGKAPFDAPQDALKKTLGELAVAAKAEATGSNVALAGRGAANGMQAKFTLALDATLSLDVEATIPSAQRGEVEKVVAALPEMKKNPGLLLGKAPPFTHELAKLLLAGTEVTLDGDEVLAAVRVDTAALKSALAPIIEAMASR